VILFSYFGGGKIHAGVQKNEISEHWQNWDVRMIPGKRRGHRCWMSLILFIQKMQ
jgi:hypothetical protein